MKEKVIYEINEGSFIVTEVTKDDNTTYNIYKKNPHAWVLVESHTDRTSAKKRAKQIWREQYALK